MLKRLPDRLDPWRFADLGNEVGGQIPLDSMSRLSECLLDTAGEASFELQFARDERRRAVMTGWLKAELTLECQRCLEAVKLPVETHVSVAFVERHDQAEQLPDYLDPIMVEENQVRFVDLIEDELLLQLPQVAMHEEGTCPVPLVEMFEDKPAEPSAQPARNPFAVLAELKGKKD
jgi:uncharacterized protein